jgi:hypothetical protein
MDIYGKKNPSFDAMTEKKKINFIPPWHVSQYIFIFLVFFLYLNNYENCHVLE